MPDVAALEPRPALPTLRTLLRPKWLTARARAVAAERGRGARWAVLALVGLGFWAVAFGMLFRVLSYFAGVEEIGALLAGRLLGLLLLSFASILLLSNVITALSSFMVGVLLPEGAAQQATNWLAQELTGSIDIEGDIQFEERFWADMNLLSAVS